MPGFLDPRQEFVLVTTSTPALAAHRLPHGVTPAVAACMVPSPQLADGLPVPGTAYHAFWPPCDQEGSEFLLFRESRPAQDMYQLLEGLSHIAP